MEKVTGILFVVLIVGVFAQNPPVDWNATHTWPGQCQTGGRQSPINIDSKDVEFCSDDVYLNIRAPCQDFHYEENGQCLNVNMTDTSFISMKKVWWDEMYGQFGFYRATEMVYHRPSEHTINGHGYDLEIQLTHEFDDFMTYMQQSNMTFPYSHEAMNMSDMEMDVEFSNMTYEELNMTKENRSDYIFRTFGDDVKKVIVSILFYECEEAEEDAFDTFWPEEGRNMSNLRQTFECIGDRFFYGYYGSETMPPCQENVVWLVLRDPLPIRKDNLNRLRDDLNGGMPNNRPVQTQQEKPEVHLVSQYHCAKYIAWERYAEYMREHYEEKMKEELFPTHEMP